MKNTIVKNAKHLQPCYLDYLAAKPERIEGRIKLDWQITTKGQVVKPDLVASEFNHASFEKCLLDKIAKLEFPPHDRKVNFYVAHEFFFKDEQSQAEASSNKTKKP